MKIKLKSICERRYSKTVSPFLNIRALFWSRIFENLFRIATDTFYFTLHQLGRKSQALAALVQDLWLEVLILHLEDLANHWLRVGCQLVLVKVISHTTTTTEPSLGVRRDASNCIPSLLQTRLTVLLQGIVSSARLIRAGTTNIVVEIINMLLLCVGH